MTNKKQEQKIKVQKKLVYTVQIVLLGCFQMGLQVVEVISTETKQYKKVTLVLINFCSLEKFNSL